MAACNFYDDKYGFEPSTTCSSEVVQKVHTWLGAQLDGRTCSSALTPRFLWCHVRPQRYAAEDQAIAESGAGRRDLFPWSVKFSHQVRRGSFAASSCSARRSSGARLGRLSCDPSQNANV